MGGSELRRRSEQLVSLNQLSISNFSNAPGVSIVSPWQQTNVKLSISYKDYKGNPIDEVWQI